MALSQKHRSSLYLSLATVVGSEEAEALLQEFPANDLETPATKDFVRAEVTGVGAELRHEINLVRTDLRHEIDLLRTDLRHEIDLLRTDMHSMFRRQTIWMVSLVLLAMSAMSAINAWVIMVNTR